MVARNHWWVFCGLPQKLSAALAEPAPLPSNLSSRRFAAPAWHSGWQANRRVPI